ncbi:MAG: N-glycosylase/DNA lyase [Candidatus Aenigmatarchaeota archaeon]
MQNRSSYKEVVRVLKSVYEDKKEEIQERLKKFEKNKNATKEEKFIELCFCILVAGNNLEKTLEIWKIIGKGFLNLGKDELSRTLKNLGYRFYNIRSKYIVENREKINLLEEFKCDCNFRKILVENFYGIGYKEASHFLRNIGCNNFAIIDRHVLKFLKSFNFIKEVPKSLNEKTYIELEKILEKIAQEIGITLAELDFCIFYYQTDRFPER